MCVFHTSLDPADQAEFTRWLDETEWTRNQILALLVEDGHTVKDLTENSFTIHRRRQCWGRRNGLV